MNPPRSRIQEENASRARRMGAWFLLLAAVFGPVGCSQPSSARHEPRRIDFSGIGWVKIGASFSAVDQQLRERGYRDSFFDGFGTRFENGHDTLLIAESNGRVVSVGTSSPAPFRGSFIPGDELSELRSLGISEPVCWNHHDDEANLDLYSLDSSRRIRFVVEGEDSLQFGSSDQDPSECAIRDAPRARVSWIEVHEMKR